MEMQSLPVIKHFTNSMSPPKKPQDSLKLRGFVGDVPARGVIDNNVIDHAQVAHVYVKSTNASAEFDRGLDHFSPSVHNVMRAVENIRAFAIRLVFTNNESLDRLASSC